MSHKLYAICCIFWCAIEHIKKCNQGYIAHQKMQKKWHRAHQKYNLWHRVQILISNDIEHTGYNFPWHTWNFLLTKCGVGEFRKTRHPRNVKLDKVLEMCFSGTGNSRFSEAWNPRSLRFANMWSSWVVIRRRQGVANEWKPGISNRRWRELQRVADSGICRGLRSGVMHGDIHEPEKQRLIRESVGDPVRESRVKIFTNRWRSKVKVVVP
jgi:hypothetical protein